MRVSAVKSKKNLVEGRSYPLNLLLVGCHLVCLYFTLDAFLNVEPYPIVWKIASFALLLLTSAALVILKGFYMYSYLARFGLALVLLIAGFGKLNDPVGFAEILRNYLQDDSLNLWMIAQFSRDWFSLESYLESAQSWAIVLSIAEILLGLMLLFHLLYKLAVWLVLPLFLILGVVSWFNYSCDSKATMERQFSLNKNDATANEFLARSFVDGNLQLVEQNATAFIFKETVAQYCPSQCGCLGADQSTFFGVDHTSKVAFEMILIGLVFSLILFITQFQMLPNSPAENTGLGILIWLFILVHGIITAWFWLVFLSGIILYLTLNLKRFGIGFLKNAFGALVVLAALLFGLVYYVISYEPLTDFRSYTLGSDLKVYLERDDNGATEKIFVYRDKRNQKDLFLSEENHATSMIWEDTNYVFLRMHDFNMIAGFGAHLKGFNPLLNVRHLSDNQELNAFIQPAYEAYFEELVEVKNIKNKNITVLRKAEFSAEMEKDTTLLIKRFTGVPADVDFVSMQDLILNTDLVFVWVVKRVSLISDEDWQKIRELNAELLKEEISFVVVGANTLDEWLAYSKYTSRDVAYLNLYHNELMNICRSNVCLMLLQNGVVAGKYPLSGLPKYETMRSKIK